MRRAIRCFEINSGFFAGCCERSGKNQLSIASFTPATASAIIGRERAQDLDDELRDLLLHSGFMSEDESHRLLKEIRG